MEADILTKEDLEYLLESLDNVNKRKNWFGYGEILKHIPNVYRTHERSETRPSNIIVNVPYHVYKGFIRVDTNWICRGGYYGFDRFLPYAVKIGSNVDNTIHNEIADYVKRVSEIYKPHLTLDGEEPFYHDAYGTAFSTYGLAR
jgi:hypothetical protein